MEIAERNELSSADGRKDRHSVRNGASGAGKRWARTGIAAPELSRAEPAAARAFSALSARPRSASPPDGRGGAELDPQGPAHDRPPWPRVSLR